MNLDKFKFSWQQYKVQNSFDRIENQEFLSIIGQASTRPSFQKVSQDWGLKTIFGMLLLLWCQSC